MQPKLEQHAKAATRQFGFDTPGGSRGARIVPNPFYDPAKNLAKASEA